MNITFYSSYYPLSLSQAHYGADSIQAIAQQDEDARMARMTQDITNVARASLASVSGFWIRFPAIEITEFDRNDLLRTIGIDPANEQESLANSPKNDDDSELEKY